MPKTVSGCFSVLFQVHLRVCDWLNVVNTRSNRRLLQTALCKRLS